jgi:hypothetical protein
MGVEIASTASNVKLIAPTLAGEYPLDYGVNTQIDAYGGSIHQSTDYDLGARACAASIIGFTDLGQYLDYGLTTTFSINCLTGVGSFPKIALRPTADGAILTFQNAAGASLGYVGTSGTPEIYWSGVIAANQFLAQPATDGSSVFLGENAEGVQLFNFSTSATASNSQLNFANGLQLNFYSDNYGTLKASIVNGVGTFATGVISPAYTAGSTAGVSCTGTPTSSFASVNGIVTHC